MPARRKKKEDPANPINARQRELLQKQEEVQRRMQKLESMLAEVPRRTQELERRQREEGVARATGHHRRLAVPQGVNVRYNTVASSAPPRKLRKERHQQKIHFFALTLLLLALLYFLYSQIL